jgi:hypothetical protein
VHLLAFPTQDRNAPPEPAIAPIIALYDFRRI